MRRCMVIGFLIWLFGTLVLRFAGQYFLHPQNVLSIALLLLASFPLMALVARRVCSDASLPREQWPAAAIFLVTPSLVLDTFSSAFFPLVYPNMPEQAAGLFGGWILWCCAGALLGVNLARR
jgi:Family of unknown function (DUF5367)